MTETSPSVLTAKYEHDIERPLRSVRPGASPCGKAAQHELAVRLHVTESAVSKWERGLSYPDITLLSTLSRELGVSEQELIRASEDQEGRANSRDARSYRTWRSAVLWSTLGAYAIALLTCFIANISVEHRLSWFWIVLPAVAIAFCLTTLPLLRLPHRGWLTLGGSVLSLGMLLLVVWLRFDQGSWLAIALTAILFALVLLFTPIWLHLTTLPGAMNRHKTVLTLAIDPLALLGFLLVVMVSSGQPELWTPFALPLATIGLVPAWAIALTIRYLPWNGLGRAAVVAAIVAVAFAVTDRAVAAVLGEPQPLPPNFGLWNGDTIGPNVQLIVTLAFAAVAILLGVASILRARRTRS